MPVPAAPADPLLQLKAAGKVFFRCFLAQFMLNTPLLHTPWRISKWGQTHVPVHTSVLPLQSVKRSCLKTWDAFSCLPDSGRGGEFLHAGIHEYFVPIGWETKRLQPETEMRMKKMNKK